MQNRDDARAARLVEAAKRVAAKIQADPKGPKAKAYRAKLAEYKESLDRLMAGERETKPTGKTGVKVDVPTGLFAVKAEG